MSIDENNSWPFIPDHISSDLKDRLSGTGIISNQELTGLQMLLCAHLERATTICEFYRGGSARTDARVPRFHWIGACRYFRQGECNRLCQQHDETVGMRFAGKTRQDLASTQQQAAIVKAFPFKNPYCEPPTIHYISDRYYLTYDCPFLGYRECVFPIFYAERVIAVLFLGQLPLIDRKERIEAAREYAFLHILPGLGMSSSDLTALRQKIDEADKRVWNEEDKRQDDAKKSPLTMTQYEVLLNKAHRELVQFENALYERVRQRQGEFALSTVNAHLANLHKKLPKQVSVTSPAPLQQLWTGVETVLGELCKAFSFRYIALFGNDNPLRSNKLTLLAYANNPDDPENYKRPSGTVRLLPDKNNVHNLTSAEWLESLPNPWPGRKALNQVSFYSQFVPFHQQDPLLFVIGHSPTLAPVHFPRLEEAIKSFGVTLVAVLTAALESLTEQKTRAAFRVLGHELRNETDGLSRVLSHYVGNEDAVKQLDARKRTQILGNVRTYVKHLNLLFGSARALVEILGGTYELRQRWEHVYGPLFYKWKDFYRAELDKNGRDMPLTPISALENRDALQPKCCGDIGLLELMVYNLLGNAEKYSYEGSVIRADCYLDAESNEYVFKVTDCGFAMPEGEEGEQCYELFGRGAQAKSTEGIGVGLALARGIAELHGGSLTHKCRKISKYHVPFLIYWSSHKSLFAGSFSVKQRNALTAEARRLADHSNLREIVARTFLEAHKGWLPEYAPLRTECEHLLWQATYEVTFEARIPQPGKDAKNAYSDR